MNFEIIDNDLYKDYDYLEDLLEYIAGKNGDASRYNVETIDGEAPTASSGDSDKAAEKEDSEKEAAEKEETADNSQTLSGWYGLTESSWEEYGNDLYLNFTDNNSGSVRDGDLSGEFKKTGNEYSYATEFGTFTFTIDVNNDGTLTYHCADGTFTLESAAKYMQTNMKINGLKGHLGNKIKINTTDKKDKNKNTLVISVDTSIQFSKRYIRYLVKKFLKRESISRYLTISSCAPNAYTVKIIKKNEA